MKKQGLFRIVLFAILIAASALTAQAQSAQISGRITDASQAVVPDASVVVANVKTGIERNTTSNQQGYYNVPFLNPGSYRISVLGDGFKPIRRDGIQLSVDQVARLDFVLEIGEVTQTIEVTAEGPLLQSDTTSLGQVIDTRKIVELPLNGRNFIQLVVLATGAYIPQRNNSTFQSSLVSINGNRIQNNNFLLDGVSNNTTDNTNPPILPSPDAIAEFKVQTNLLPAEFGRGLGGTVNINIKSGTNEFHGTAFEFLRNSALDANAFFNSSRPKPQFQQNQFGFSAGGPVFIPKLYQGKNRTFFFGDYQGTRIRRGLTRIFTVPTEATRSGDFSGGATIYDPETTRPNPQGTGFIRDPFPGNRIPANRFDPVMQRFLSLYPLPNRAGTANNFVVNPKLMDDNDQGDVRIDHTLSPQDSLFTRYSYSDNPFVAPLNIQGVPLGGYFFEILFLPRVIRAHGVAIGETHIFSPRIINEFRFGFNRLFVTILPRSGGVNLAPQFGITGVPDERDANGLTVINTPGLSPLGDRIDTRRGQNVFHVRDSLSILSGRHTFKMGFDHRRTQFNFKQGASPRGVFNYSNVFTNNPENRSGGNALADFLLGYPLSSAIGREVQAGVRIRNSSAFLQDDFRVTPRLTLNLGLRYEYTTPVTDVNNRMASFDIATNSVILAKPGSLRDRALANPDRNNFEPRFGIAYQLTSNTVLRTGYGVFHTLEDAGHHDPMFNPPYLLLQNFISDQVNPATSPRPSRGFPVVAQGSDFRNLFVGLNARPVDFPAAYSQQWNLTLERQIGNLLLEAAYVGNKANKLMAQRDINQPLAGSGSVNSRRIFPGWGSINYVEPRGNSIYHGLQLKAEKRLSKGLTLLGSYSFAKAQEDADSTNLLADAGTPRPQDQRNLRAERSRSVNDVRHRMVASYVYELPFGAGKAFLKNAGGGWNRVIGGWQINGITSLQTGRPFTVNSPSDQSNTGSANPRPDATGISPELPSISIQ